MVHELWTIGSQLSILAKVPFRGLLDPHPTPRDLLGFLKLGILGVRSPILSLVVSICALSYRVSSCLITSLLSLTIDFKVLVTKKVLSS